EGRVVGEIKAQAIGAHKRAFLLRVIAEHLSERPMDQMCRRMVATSGAAALGINGQLSRSFVESTGNELSPMNNEPRDRSLSVLDAQRRHTSQQGYAGTNLPAAIAINTSARCNDFNVCRLCATRIDRIHQLAVVDQRHNRGFICVAVVPGKDDFFTRYQLKSLPVHRLDRAPSPTLRREPAHVPGFL